MNLADRYARLLDNDGRVREEPPSASPAEQPPPLPRMAREVTETEVQTRWFAGEFGREFTTTQGRPAFVADFGSWNRGAGPCFIGALVSFGGEHPVGGGIEVTGSADGWHGQNKEEDEDGGRSEAAVSSEYENTVLHVFAGGGAGGNRGSQSGAEVMWKKTVTAGGREVPQIALDVTRLEFAGAELPSGSGGSRDLHGPPCVAPLSGVGESDAAELLEAAAQYRLCRKAARLRRLCAQSASDEGLYQALAETLGYKHNKLPFRLLAQRFPLSALRRPTSSSSAAAAADNSLIEPFLFAGSGFLAATDLGAMPGDTRGYLRDLWEQWWPHRADNERLVIPRQFWTLKGTRPVNHPQRRVAALAEIVRNWPIVQSLAESGDIAAIRAYFARLRHPYWDFHYTLSSQPSRVRMALVGQTRVTDMLANVFYPAAISAGSATVAPRLWQSYRAVPAPDSNQKVDLAAGRLFGSSPVAKRLVKKAVYQQGILQLFEDYCLECGGDCARCALPERVKRWLG